MGLGMVATAGAGFLSLAAMLNPGHAHADDIGLVLGGSGTPIPGTDYVESAALHYLFPTYGNSIDFYQSTPSNPFGEGVFTPEGLYPLTGVKTLPFNYPSGTDGFPDQSTSVGQGDTILANTIESDIANGNTDTVFGYSQSSVISGLVMQELTDAGIPKSDVNFLLVADETAPNGGLLSRFDGFTPSSGPAVSDPLNLPSLGIGFDGATPSSDYATNIYTIEYDGFADFPKYPLNFLSDLNAFLGIESLHGTYLNGGDGTDGLGSGPSLGDINNATQLPVSADDLNTNYFMITTLDGTDAAAGHEITAPLVALLPTQLQELLGPDLTYLINLGYGDGSVGYSTTDADVNTPFGLSNGVSATTEWNTLVADTQQGIQNLMTDTDPYAAAATSSGAETATAVSAAAPTLTDIADAFSSALSTANSVFLPLSDISNALTTSLPAYDWSLFSDNIATGDYTDAFGLPIAANTALDTLAAGFAVEVLQSAASQIAADFASIGF
jgi:hypothetical protein